MKKLVAVIVPMVEAGAASDPARPMLSREQTETGALKVEAILSDSDAERILSTVAACKVSTPDKLFVTHLVEQELALAGPHAHDLWQRIVSGVERKLISQVYADCDGVKTRAAARLGIDRNTLHKKLQQYDLIGDDADQNNDE
jgi:DNA-binding protein Fis